MGTWLLVGLAAWLTACKPAGELDEGPHSALGQVTAEVTAEALQNHGKVVVLISSEDEKPVTGTGKAAAVFQERLKGMGLQVEAVEVLPSMGAVMVSGMEPVSAAQFLALYGKHPSADAIVSFVGAPRFSAEQIAQLPQPRPKFIAAVTFNPPARDMYTAGVLYATILARPTGPGQTLAADTPTEFSANYQLIRAGEVRNFR